jgi:DNA modification methylase
MENKILQGDCLIRLKELEDNSIDSIVTDPPYELGFMGKSWDNTGIANNKEMWKECLRVLKPGGHLLAFSGTRTYHRMASAIEDAGFEVRDMIEWVYGSGFPKSLNIGKKVDELQGNEREVVGTQTNIANKSNDNTGRYNWNTENQIRKDSIDITKGTSEWEGWGTALKPAHEPICMARKPIEKTVAENCLKWGVGGINIDGCRVENTGKSTLRPLGKSAYQKGGGIVNGGIAGTHEVESEFGGGHEGGRFPANLIHDNSEEVRECFPDAKGWSSQKHNNFNPYGGNALNESKTTRDGFHEGYNDSGNASRFFKSILYYPKASKSERNKGCEGLEEKESTKNFMIGCEDKGNNVDSSIRKYETPKNQNNHPTVKPIALMEYLIKMVTPKGGIVLDPFAGSGSTLIAAKQNGFQYIGIELTEEYIPIIEARLKAVKRQNLTQTNIYSTIEGY